MGWASCPVRIIEAKKRLQAGGLGKNEGERLEREVETHEAGIDQLVDKLYALSDDEIRLVEGAMT